jgi:hypothetical protein
VLLDEFAQHEPRTAETPGRTSRPARAVPPASAALQRRTSAAGGDRRACPRGRPHPRPPKTLRRFWRAAWRMPPRRFGARSPPAKLPPGTDPLGGHPRVGGAVLLTAWFHHARAAHDALCRLSRRRRRSRRRAPRVFHHSHRRPARLSPAGAKVFIRSVRPERPRFRWPALERVTSILDARIRHASSIIPRAAPA